MKWNLSKLVALFFGMVVAFIAVSCSMQVAYRNKDTNPNFTNDRWINDNHPANEYPGLSPYKK